MPEGTREPSTTNDRGRGDVVAAEAAGRAANHGGEATRRAIVVAGMHRSGTSAVTRVLNLLGAALPKNLAPAIEGVNDAGFWEPARLVELHDEILASAGLAWHDVAPLPHTWYGSTAAGPLKRRLVELLADEYGDAPFFVVKDPRVCRLVPLWADALADIGCEPLFVLPFRNPLEVALSLERRDGLSISHGLLLWLRYVIDAERDTRPFARAFLSYADLLGEWRRVVREVAFGLGIAWDVPPEQIERQVETFLSPELRHFEQSDRTVRVRSDVIAWVKQAYAGLLEATAAPDAPQATFNRLSSRLEEAHRAFGPLLAEQVERLDAARSREAAAAKHVTELEVEIGRRGERLRTLEAAAHEFEVAAADARQDAEAARVRAQELEREAAARVEELEGEAAARARAADAQQDAEAARVRAQELEREAAARVEELEGEAAARARAMEELERRAATALGEAETARARAHDLAQALAARDRELGAARAAEQARAADAAASETRLTRLTLELERARDEARAVRAELRRRSDEIARVRRSTALGAPDAAAPAARVLSRPRYEWSRRRTLSHLAAWVFRRPPGTAARYLRAYLALRRSELFDPEYYAVSHPDVAGRGLNPLLHYIEHGARERRDPSGSFRTGAYLRDHPEVARSGVNPLLDFLQRGGAAAEGARAGAEAAPPATVDGRRGEPRGTSEPPAPDSAEVDAAARRRFDAFLATGDELAFPRVESPALSVVIPTYGQPHLTLETLRGLQRVVDEIPFEVVVVDNGSRDRTQELLDRLVDVTVHRNGENLGFAAACNAGAELSRAPVLCFLNSDAVVHPGSLATLTERLRTYPQCGAVGGSLVHPSGRLQEAGGIVWSDGSAWAYGVGDDPDRGEYAHVREVDFCSAACLVVDRDAFARAGGFDPRYTPAYYEDVDLCLALRSLGYRVVYDGAARATHFEFGSGEKAAAIELQLRNRAKLVEKWAHVLTTLSPPEVTAVARERDRRPGRRVLVVDDRVPAAALGSGFPRTRALLETLDEAGYVVTYLPTNEVDPDAATLAALRGSGIEIIDDEPSLEPVLAARPRLYDAAVVSRPHNTRFFDTIRRYNPEIGIAYDAEAVFALREILRSAVHGPKMPDEEANRMIEAEVSLAAEADVVLAVSAYEAAQFRSDDAPRPVHVWPNAVAATPSPSPFGARRDVLFVGNLATAPNRDAVMHFVESIWPAIRKRIDARLTIVGAGADAKLEAVAGRAGATLVGPVRDLREQYDQARVFVAPHRFAAGVPLKVIDAMANGVPCVVSPLLATQLGANPGAEVLVGEPGRELADRVVAVWRDERLWSRVRTAALDLVEERFSPSVMREALVAAIETAVERATSVEDRRDAR